MDAANETLPTIAIPSWAEYLLLDDEQYSAREHAHRMITERVSEHDEQTWQVVKQAIDEGVNTERCRLAWRKVLSRRHLMLTALEALWWDRLGDRDAVSDETMSGYSQMVAEHAETLRADRAVEVPALIALLHEQGVLDEVQTALVEQRAGGRLAAAAERLIGIASEREQLTLARLDAIELRWHSARKAQPMVVIESRIGSERVVQAFSLLDERIEGVDSHELGLPAGKTVPELDPSRDAAWLHRLGIAAVSYRVDEGVLPAEALAQALTVYYAPLLD